MDIRVRIAPNTFEITSAIVFEGDKNKECRVDTIQEIDNRASNSEKFAALMDQWRKALGISQQMEELSDDNRELVRMIREHDRTWTPTQGFIYVPHIIEQRDAVDRLSDEAEGSIALLGVERGGGMLAQQIEHENKIIVEHQYGENKYGRITRKKSLETEALIAELKGVAERNIGVQITVSIAETVVGGGSATGVIKAIEKSNILSEHPNLTVKLLLLQQTMHSTSDSQEAEGKISRRLNVDDDRRDREEGTVRLLSTPTGRVQVVLSSTPYILGEDVDYQLKKVGENSQKPIILYGVNSDQFVLKRITPERETTSRDVILMLSKGELDQHITSMI